jgi:hypothetical protein
MRTILEKKKVTHEVVDEQSELRKIRVFKNKLKSHEFFENGMQTHHYSL